MNNTNHIEPINLMYYTKKSILLYERVFGRTPAVDFNDVSELQTIPTKERFESICNKIQEILNGAVLKAPLSDEDKEFLTERNYNSFVELAEQGDFGLITEKYHRRKFFNEIRNDIIVASLIEAFERLWELPSEGPYFIEVYDLGDEAIFFKSYEAMKQFADEYDVAPYTAFEVKEHHSEELYSE